MIWTDVAAWRALTGLVPRPVRSYLRDARRELSFRRAIGRFREDPERGARDRDLLEWLIRGWGNPGWAASADFLSACVKLALEAERPLLECGSGLTTLLMGMATRPDCPVHSIEHIGLWSGKVTRELRRHGVHHARVHQTRLVSYGDFHWYDLSGLTLPRAGFGGVVCDGPPSETPGGRYGLLPVAKPYLAAGCVILLDDFAREGERETVDRWRLEYGVRVARLPDSNAGFVWLQI